MKDIKFRGKRFDNGELVIGDLIENQGRSFIYHATSESTIEDNADGRIVIAAVEVDPATVEQYIGPKNKIDIEITSDGWKIDVTVKRIRSTTRCLTRVASLNAWRETWRLPVSPTPSCMLWMAFSVSTACGHSVSASNKQSHETLWV